jgi:hypothetical protein
MRCVLPAVALSALLLVAGAEAQPTRPRIPPQEGADDPRTIFSTSRRFMISGCVPLVAADLVRWADEVAARLEENLGPTPFERGEYIEITCRDLQAAPRVERHQDFSDGFLRQRLELYGLAQLDQEDVLEGLTWLLLNRRVAARQEGHGEDDEPGRVPDWLAVGVAQGLYAELRERNLGAGLERWAAGQMVAPDRLTARLVMPAGRWAEKVDAALWVAWLLSRPDALAQFNEAWDRVAGRQPLPAAWWMAPRGGEVARRQAEREWELWLAEQRDALRGWGGLNAQQLAHLRDVRQVEAVDLAAVHAPAELGSLGLDQLVQYRDEKWARLLASRIALRLRLTAVGQSVEVQTVASLYADYLDAITGKGGYGWSIFRRGPSVRKLRGLWQAAEEARERLEGDYEARANYLERVSAQLFDAGSKAEPAEPVDPAVQRYLDDVEERAPAPSAP